MERWGIFTDGRMIGAAQIIFLKAKRGKMLFVPHGPLFASDCQQHFPDFLEFLKIRAKEQKTGFVRISPWLESNDENRSLFKELRMRPSPTLMHTEETWLLDIGKNEDELLKGMRKTTRNLIRNAQRGGVIVSQSKKMEDINFLFNLQKETAKRHNFVPFPKKYLEDEFRAFLGDNQAVLFLGVHEGRVLSTALVIFYGKFAFYFQSASVNTNVPVSYLLQWEIIKEAKKRGCMIYNFWGVAPENEPGHKWQGITTFKTGFGGYRKNYLHAHDLPLSLSYWKTYLIEKIPRTWRARLTSLRNRGGSIFICAPNS